MNSFSGSRLNKSTLSTSPNLSTTLSDKIIECWMRQNHGEYQQLLIEAKQLELALLEQEAKNKVLLRSFEKKKKEIDELQAKLREINLENQEKKNYLIGYYQHLNDKLKSQVGSINLFSKLESLSLTLNAKLESERLGLDEEVVRLKSEIVRLEEEEAFLDTKKDNLRGNLRSLREAKQLFKVEEVKKKQEQRKQRQAEKQKYDGYLNEIQAMLLEKQHLESSQNVLKKLLNIEETHKKHWLLIERAIKWEFTRKSTENHYNESMTMEYKLKANEMENLVNQRKAEIAALKDEYSGVRKKRENAKRVLEESSRKYNEIQSQVKQQSPTK